MKMHDEKGPKMYRICKNSQFRIFKQTIIIVLCPSAQHASLLTSAFSQTSSPLPNLNRPGNLQPPTLKDGHSTHNNANTTTATYTTLRILGTHLVLRAHSSQSTGFALRSSWRPRSTVRSEFFLNFNDKDIFMIYTMQGIR